MFRLAIALFLTILTAVPLVGAAEGDKPPGSDLDEVLKKVFLAYGGKDALCKLGNSSLALGQQKNFANPEKEQVNRVRHIRKGKGLRIDVEDESGWTTTVFDGLKAWKVQGKVVTDLSPEETKILSLEKDREPSVLCFFGDDGYQFKFLGNTVHNAIPVFGVEVNHGPTASTVFIDQKNYLVTAVEYTATDATDATRKAKVTTEFSEYRPAAGALVPFKQTQFIEGKKMLEFAVDNIDLAGVAEDELFRRPDRPFDIRLEKALVLPFLFSHKEIMVKARLGNGEPLNFLVDTGSTQTVIDRRVAAENLLDRRQDVPGIAPGGVFVGQQTELPELMLGDVKLGGIQAVILDLNPQSRQLGKPIAGILGANVLSRFAFTIDYGKQQLIFADKDAYKAPAAANVLPFTDKKGPMIKALINGKEEVQFLVDTGAIFNYLPTTLAKKYSAGQTARFTEGIGIDGRPVRLGIVQIGTVKVGSSIARDIAFTYSVSDADKNKPGVAAANHGILGNPFWQNFTLTIDYRMRQLIVQANPLLASRQQLESLVTTGDKKMNVDHDYRAAETAYQQALSKVQFIGDPKQQARIWGRLGNLRRAMAKDLNRPEQARVAYEYFSKAAELARKMEDREIEGRVLADWALLYIDNNQFQEARQALDGAIAYAPQDPQVNVNFAVYLFKMKLYGDMRGYIDKALFLEPSNWQALWYRLKLCEMFNDLNQQKETLKEIIKYYPWSKLAQDKMAALLNPTQPTTPGTTAPPVTPPAR